MNIEDEEKVVEEKIKDAWTANKWRVIALVLFVLLLIVGTKAFAGTATVTWTNPTTYTDGTAIATGDISQTRIEYGSCNGAAFGTKAGEQTVTGAGTTLTINSLGAGTYCFRGFTTAKGVESAASNVASKAVPQAAPNPPTLVTVATTAYVAVKWRDRYVMLPLGTVAKGVACRADMKLDGLYALPAGAVKSRWPSQLFWGRCA